MWEFWVHIIVRFITSQNNNKFPFWNSKLFTFWCKPMANHKVYFIEKCGEVLASLGYGLSCEFGHMSHSCSPISKLQRLFSLCELGNAPWVYILLQNKKLIDFLPLYHMTNLKVCQPCPPIKKQITQLISDDNFIY
jgi:hypothetical protein